MRFPRYINPGASSPGRIWTCRYPAKLSQLAGGAGKITFFGGFLPVFRPVFCFFTGHLYVQSLFCKKKSVHLTCSGRRSAHYKVPPRIGGCHFLLCQHTNTKDIAGRSANGRVVFSNLGGTKHLTLASSLGILSAMLVAIGIQVKICSSTADCV